MSPDKKEITKLVSARLLLILALSLLLGAPLPLRAFVKVGAAAPDFSLTDINGKRFTLGTSLKSLKDQQLLVLYFFDVDSPSSREGLLSLLRTTEKLRPRHQVIGISSSPRDRLFQFAQEEDGGFRLLLDDGTVRGLYNAGLILPVTCVIDSRHMVVDHHMGGGKAALAMFDSLTKSSPRGKAPSRLGKESGGVAGETSPVIESPAALKRKPSTASEPASVKPSKGVSKSSDRKKKVTTAATKKPVETSAGVVPIISLTTSKESYSNGEYISMEVTATEDVYLHLYHVSSDGAVTRVIPNPLQPYVRLRSGENLLFPIEGIELQALSTPGRKEEKELFVVIATRKNQDLEKSVSQRGIVGRADLDQLIATIPERERATKEYTVVNE